MLSAGCRLLFSALSPAPAASSNELLTHKSASFSDLGGGRRLASSQRRPLSLRWRLGRRVLLAFEGPPSEQRLGPHHAFLNQQPFRPRLREQGKAAVPTAAPFGRIQQPGEALPARSLRARRLDDYVYREDLIAFSRLRAVQSAEWSPNVNSYTADPRKQTEGFKSGAHACVRRQQLSVPCVALPLHPAVGQSRWP